jgi:hypothetical protein
MFLGFSELADQNLSDCEKPMDTINAHNTVRSKVFFMPFWFRLIFAVNIMTKSIIKKADFSIFKANCIVFPCFAIKNIE